MLVCGRNDFSLLLLEIATKRHTERAILREEELKLKRVLDPDCEGWTLAEFGDRLTYAGCVPSGKYFADVLKAHSRSTRAHMDAEVRAPPLASETAATPGQPATHGPTSAVACAMDLTAIPAPLLHAGEEARVRRPQVQRTRTCRMCGDTESCPGRFGGAHNCTEFDV